MAETTETLILDIQFDSNEAIKETAQLRNEVTKLKDANKDIIKTEGQVTEQYVKNIAQIKILNDEIRTNERSLSNQAKAQIAAKGSNEQLRAQLSVLTSEYNKLSEEERNSTVAGQVLQKQIENISNTLKGNEGAVGDFRRNVGDYEGAFTRASNSIAAMQERIKELDTVIKNSDVGSDAFREANDEAQNLRLSVDQALGKVNEYGETEPKNPLKKQFEDTTAAAGALISVAELTNLALSDNETVNESVATSLRAVAVAQQVANIVKEKGAILDTASLVQTTALSAAQGGYALAVGTSTGALKLFRIALAATGIGLIVVAIGALIANFDDLKNAVTDFLGLTSEQERASKALQAEYTKESERLGFLFELEQKRQASIQASFDRQIKLAEAAGNSTIEIEERKAAAYRASTKELIEQLKVQLEQAKQSNQSAAELQRLTDAISQAYSGLADSFTESSVRSIKKTRELTQAAIEEEKKRTDAAKAAQEERAKISEEAAKRELEIQRELSDQRIQNLQDERTKEILIVQQAAQDRIDAIDSNSDNAESLRLAIVEATENEIAAIQTRFREAKIEADRVAFEEELARLQTLKESYDVDLLDREAKLFARLELERTIRQLNLDEETAALIRTTEGANALIALEQATGQTRKDIVEDYYRFFDEQGELSFEAYVELQNRTVEVQQASYEQQVSAAMEFGTAVGGIFADSLKEQGQDLKNFGRQFIILILDVLQKQVNAAIASAAAQSLAQADSVASFGATGAIRAGILTAAINGAFQLAKAKLSQPPQGFADGVIGLQGAGTSTSDSIPAMLSVGESVITANGTQYAQQNMPGLLDFLNSPNKFATGVVDFQGGASSLGTGSDGFAVLAEAIMKIQPVVRVSDINKGQNDYSEVRVTGTLR
jgi:hypothetical protein